MPCFILQTGQTLRKYCTDNGISYSKMYHRCDTLGMTPDQAIALEKDIKPKNFLTINGYSLRGVCEMLGLNYNVVVSTRTNHKLSAEGALARVLKRNPLTSQQKGVIKLLGDFKEWLK